MQQQTGEESRKRKRGTNEGGAEKRKDIAGNFVSEKTTSLMEESLKERGFIAERGFKKVITPFAEVLEKRGWQSLGEYREPGSASLVKEFFANMVEKEGKKVYVKGHWVEFSREEINKLFNLRVQKDGALFKKQIKEPKLQKIVDLLTVGKGEWKWTKKTPCRSIARGDLTEEVKVWFYFIKFVLLPSKHLSTVRREEEILLYALLKGYKINVGKIIEKSILGYSEGNCWGMIPHPETITMLCIQGGVDEEWGIEETYPRASPLTLTGVTKGPKNRGKNEKKETEEQKGNEGCTELKQWESLSQMQLEVQRSQSQFWSAPLELRQNRNEQIESSGQNCNHTELIEFLMSMRQEMKARDDQLRTQLQLREEYFDAELKRRD